MKFNEMKKIAQYAFNIELTEIEVDELNIQLNELKSKVQFKKTAVTFCCTLEKKDGVFRGYRNNVSGIESRTSSATSFHVSYEDGNPNSKEKQFRS